MHAGPRRPTAALALIALAACTPYASGYRPPLDGRARVVWSEGEMVVEPSGLFLTAECGAAIRALTGRASVPMRGGTVDLPMPTDPNLALAAAVWQPIYYGDPIVAQPGYGAPVFVNQPLYFWVPGLYWNDPIYARQYGGGIRSGLGLPISGGGSGGGRGGGGHGHGGGGGGGGGGGDEAAVLAAVLVAATLPIVDVAVAASSPISQSQAARATDIAAAWNDLARTPGSPCAMPGGAQPLPPETLAVPSTYGAP